MRIALIIDRFDAARGGGEGYAASLARGLSLRGHQLHVFSHDWARPLQGVRYHRLPMVPYPRWLKALSMAWYGSRILPSGDFDVVQGFGGVPAVNVHRPGGGTELDWLGQEIRSRGRGLPKVVTALNRTISLKLAVNLLVERALYGNKGGPSVIANSQRVRADILRRYGRMDAGKIHVIYNGVDLQRFHPRNRELFRRRVLRELLIDDKTVVLLFMAHNFRLKGLHCLMKALQRLDRYDRNWTLLVGGRGRKAPYLRLAEKLGIEERTLFLGPVEAPEAVLGACDVVVHPTFYDPFSNVCLEAMACGVPVITTRQNGAGELLQEGVSGYVVPSPEDSALLAEGIMALMDPGSRERMGQQARRVAEGFSWETHVEAVEGVYRGLLDARRGQGG